jgi:hypothetical protein
VLTTDRDQARARVTELEAKLTEFNALQAAIADLEAKRTTVAQQAAAVIAQHGFTPDRQQTLPAPAASADSGDIIAQFNAIEDPKERSAFYAANKDKLLAARFPAEAPKKAA